MAAAALLEGHSPPANIFDFFIGRSADYYANCRNSESFINHLV